ncbi:acetolactate synthase large subunit [Neobacillus piezotolerans]|uniref:Acetolactate synthase large subunit n=1 Tax=Neobacillus piezotolerans TaxID=2259171 RepID=A0A3D8GWK0_9BACI|nr:acetolactate synthase large subunit [Neobacillus piezotolerans]RDU38830.1 acetolactate synthase large subunit [Neobacillus piezotolerans]
MKAADVLVKCLENEGVEFIFGIVGTEVLALVDSLSKSDLIQFINVRHEEGAAFMADVYGRLSGKTGVCLATLGPGATNLVTGTASAQLDHSPLVSLIGQADTKRHHEESHQYVDLVKLFEPVTKDCTQIVNPETLPTVIRKAFKFAAMEKPGAAAIVIPEDILTTDLTKQPLAATPPPRSVPTGESVDAAVQLIKKHAKPYLLIGNGLVRQDAVSELRTFIDTLNAPVSHSFKAKGILEPSHPQNYLTFGFNEKDEALSGIGEADLLIVIGFDFSEKLPEHWNKKQLPVLHIDSLPAETNEYYPVAAELVGNIKETLRLLNQSEITKKAWVPSGNLKAAMMDAFKLNKQPHSEKMSIEEVLQSIEKLTPNETVLISDVGDHKVAIARTYQPKMPNRLVISNGLATMGIAIPGCIGAKLACPDAPVIAVTGDGGALMHFAELETARRLGLSFLVIVINDLKLKLEVKQMEKKFGESYGVRFDNPDYTKLAESFGIDGKRVATLTEFETALTHYLSEPKGIALIELLM